MAESGEQVEKQFTIQRIYMKDLSFESPSAPATFKQQWQPEIDVELHNHSSEFEDGLFEVVLSITVTAKNSGENAFIAEVHQCGLFAIKGLTKEELEPMLGSFCPNILFPYAREAITDLVTRGGFPQLLLNPVNFDAIYSESKKRKEEKH